MKISNTALSDFLKLLCAEQDVGNLKKCTVRNSETHVRRTTRRNSQKHAFSGILGLPCAEQDVGNLQNGLSGILELLCAEQDVGNLKKWTFRNSGTPVRRTERRKYQKLL